MKQPQPHIEDLLFIFYKWKWSIVTIVMLTVFCTAFWVFALKDELYMSEAKLLIKAGQEDAAPSTLMDKQPSTVGYRSADVKSEGEILHSTDLLLTLIDKYHLDRPQPAQPPVGFIKTMKFKLKGAVQSVRDSVDNAMIAAGLHEKLQPREKTLAALQKGLIVKAEEGTNVVTANLILPFRTGSAEVLNSLIEEYQKFRLDLYRDRGDEFFRTAMDKRQRELMTAELEKNTFESGASMPSAPQQKTVLIEHLSELQQARHDAEVEYREALSRANSLDAELKNMQPNFGALGGFDDAPFQRALLSDIAGLEKRRQELLLTERDDSDRVKNISQQIGNLSSMLQANVRSVLSEKKARFDASNQELARVGGDLGSIHHDEVKWLDLQRKAQSLDEEYQFFRRKYEESAVARTALEQRITSNVAVTQHATDPLEPLGIHKSTYLGFSVIFGIVMALAYVAIAEFMDDRLYTASQVERELGAPVLGIVPSGGRKSRPEAA